MNLKKPSNNAAAPASFVLNSVPIDALILIADDDVTSNRFDVPIIWHQA